VKPWYKEPYRLQDAGYCGMPQNARAVFHGLYELLMKQPVITAEIPQLASWMSLTRDGVRRSLEAVQASGLINLEIVGSRVTASLPSRGENVAPVSREGSAGVASVSRRSSADVVPVLRQGSADVASVSRPCSVASSNDAGLKPANLPLEENRIDKNRKEEKRIEEKKAPVGAASAEPPLVFGSLTLEEAQEVIQKAHERHPGLQRFKDDRTGEPMDDMLFGAILLWIKNKPRAIELGITTDPAEVIKTSTKKTEEPREPTKVKAERPADCDEQVWKDWMKARGRNALTDTAWGAMLNEASKAGITPAEAVKVCAERGWRGFRADWLTRDKVSRPGRREEVDIAAIWGRKPVYEREA
jgi:hypothetical protein